MAVTSDSKVGVHKSAESAVRKAESDVPDGYIRIHRAKGSVAMPKPYQDLPHDHPHLYNYVRKSQDTNNLLIGKIECGGSTAEAAYKQAKSHANDYRKHLERVAQGEALPNFIPGVEAVARNK